MSLSQDPLGVARRAVELALQAGAEKADAYVQFASELNLEVRRGEMENLRRAMSRGLGLRVSRNRRMTLVHTTDLGERSLARLAARAVEMTGSLKEQRDEMLLAAPGAITTLTHPDSELHRETVQTKVTRMCEVESAMTEVKGVARAVSVSWTEVDGVIALANSRGHGLSEPFCHMTLEAECLAEQGDQSYTGSRHVRVPSRRYLPEPAQIGREAAERAVGLLGARPIPSTKAPVIFTPDTGWTLLVYLALALRGDHVVHERSYLAGRLGQTIAADEMTIPNDPLLEQGPSRRSFDAEGSAAKKSALIERGVMSAYLTDLASAARLELPSGGNAVRDGYDQRVSIGAANLYMEAGRHTPQEIIAQTERGLLVNLVSGWWVGLSPATDTFSSAAMGFWIEHGKLVRPVRGVTIGGNLRDMLMTVDMIGNDLSFLERTSTPTFRVSEMAISGI